MSNLSETTTYDAGVYQLERADPVDAGVAGAGIANSQGHNLANRTNYLKAHVDALEAGSFIPPTVAPLNSPALTGTPTAPTPALGDSSTKIATTAFVQNTLKGILSKDVAGSSNVTLSAVEAGNGILQFTGALTGNINVIVPNAGKWVAENQTTGAFTLTLKTAAGTGVALTSGYSYGVVADGTNLLEADSVIDGGTY